MPDSPPLNNASPLNDEEQVLAEMMADAAGVPVAVWRGEGLAGDPETLTWALVETFRDTHRLVQPEAPIQALQAATQVDRVVAKPFGEETSSLAIRLGPRSTAFATILIKAEHADWGLRLVESVASRYRSTQTAAELREENEAFAGQLASDLEELSFLRSMVDRLSSAQADDGLAGMAAATLPVLNATVRARCLAYFRLPNPQDPYNAEPTVVEGDEPLDHATLASLVLRLGPSATEQPLVRNWDSTDLLSSVAAIDEDRFPGVKSLVLAPLRSGPRMLGWLAAVNRSPMSPMSLENSWQLASDEFGSGEATLMATTATVLATHAANLDLLREKEQLMVSMVRSLVSAIESKDKYTRGHSERVALYTKRLAQEMGYFDAEVENIYLSALLHDVGKIGVRDAVLQKDGRLTEEEYAEISRHPEEGWSILGNLDQLRYVLPGVLHHHERWDGRGYPDGLAGEDIPLDGRVMAVADAFDAMTSDRPYRNGMPVEKAVSIIQEGAGTQWAPPCVEAFLACLDDICRIKDEYRATERQARERTSTRDESIGLPHEVAGLAE